MAKQKKKKTMSELMLDDLKELNVFLEKGGKFSEKYTVRTVYDTFAPREYTPEMVRRTRDVLNASQTVFAKVIAVSPKTVQAWERGDSIPSPVCRRLLDVVNANPQEWIALLKNTTRDVSSNKSA
jgi:putative transcriptional regulator